MLLPTSGNTLGILLLRSAALHNACHVLHVILRLSVRHFDIKRVCKALKQTRDAEDGRAWVCIRASGDALSIHLVFLLRIGALLYLSGSSGHLWMSIFVAVHEAAQPAQYVGERVLGRAFRVAVVLLVLVLRFHAVGCLLPVDGRQFVRISTVERILHVDDITEGVRAAGSADLWRRNRNIAVVDDDLLFGRLAVASVREQGVQRLVHIAFEHTFCVGESSESVRAGILAVDWLFWLWWCRGVRHQALGDGYGPGAFASALAVAGTVDVEE